MDDRDSTSTTSLTSWDNTSTSTSSSSSSSSPDQGILLLRWLQNFRGKDLVQVAADLAWAFLEVVSMEGIGRTESKDEFRRILEKFGIFSQGSSLTIPTYPDAILWTFLQQGIERFADMAGQKVSTVNFVLILILLDPRTLGALPRSATLHQRQVVRSLRAA
ncbi:hypothetical protein DL96DRAFT_1711667 [Flagelloscypha sp. PMI_526]|nr:hypothetical protein DL96DRAFT_1711667 [Flagelloscypha sp. PMI_526]